MGPRIEEMVNFLIPQLVAAGHKAISESAQFDFKNNQYKVNYIEIETPTKNHGVIWLHDKNHDDLDRIVAATNKQTTINFKEGNQAPLFTGHVFYKHPNKENGNKIPKSEKFLVSRVGNVLSRKQGKQGKNKQLELKNYEEDKLRTAVELKRAEKLGNVRVSGKFIKPKYQNACMISYFQPKTAKLKEELRTYHHKSIILDNSHIQLDNLEELSMPPKIQDPHYDRAIQIESDDPLVLIGLPNNKLIFSNGIYQPTNK